MTRDLLSQEASRGHHAGEQRPQPRHLPPQWLADYYRLRQPQLKPLLESWQREAARHAGHGRVVR